MNVLLRLNEGVVSLARYDSVKVIERAGHRLLIGEVSGQLIEHVLAVFDRQPNAEEDKAAALLDRLWDGVGAVQSVATQWNVNAAGVTTLIDVRDLTIAPTEEIERALAATNDPAGPTNDPPGPAEAEPSPSPTAERLVVRLKRGESLPKEVWGLKGRTIADVQMAGEVVAFITDGE